MTNSILYAAAISALLVQCTSARQQYHNKPSFAFVQHSRPTNQLNRQQQQCADSSCSHLFSTTIDEIPSDAALDQEDAGESSDPESILQSRNKLLALSKTLADNSPSGKFIARPSDKIKLQNAINDLEAKSSPLSGDQAKEMLVGDWTLIATANLPSSDIRRRFDNKSDDDDKKKSGKGGWFSNKNGKKKERRSGLSLFGSDGPILNPIQKSIRKTIGVTQRIRNMDGSASAGDIDRVDNVIEITPLDTLEDIIPSESPLYNIFGNVNVNPLQVTKSKIVLVHKAEVESVEPVLRTKISLTSTVANVAGTSQFFEPDGADVFGVNNLLGEFQSGTFDTPFVDKDIRISRTSGPVFEQLRVFVREGSTVLDDVGLLDSLTAEMRVAEDKAVKESESTELGTQIKKVVEATASMAENARSTIEKDMEGVTTALGDTIDDVTAKVQDAVEDDLERIGEAVESVQSAIQDGDGESIGEAITNVTKAVTQVPGDVQKIVEEDMSELADEVEEVLDTMVADVQDIVESDLKEIGDAIEEIRDTAAGTGEEGDGDGDGTEEKEGEGKRKE